MSGAARRVSRPILRWHGGKWRLAPWIIEHFPALRTYVEPFAGAASVLMRKPRSFAEIINDKDAEVVNLFRVLRSPESARLVEMLRLTPFARDEFEEAYEATEEPLERARRLVVRSYMGFGSNGRDRRWKTGFRANSTKAGTTPCADWHGFPDSLAATIERLRGVVVENRDALDIIRTHDSPDTLFYLDPPYVWETRSQSTANGPPTHGYDFEMSNEAHVSLLECIMGLEGMVVLSGYAHPLYDEALKGWEVAKRRALVDASLSMEEGARLREEVLWINPAASHRPQLGLFR